MFYRPETGDNTSYRTLEVHSDAVPQTGSIVEVRQGSRQRRLAVVEAVSEDGTLIWLAAHGAHTRALFHREEASAVWTSGRES
jgi:hypothetical protein